MPKKPTATLTEQVLATMTAMKIGDGQEATVVMAGGNYTGPLSLQWADNNGAPVIVSVTVEVSPDGRRVLIPWHAVRAIEPAQA